MNGGAPDTGHVEDAAASFDPVIGAQPRVLVLGSIPGRRSLDANQYYAHPRNAFWPVMAELVGLDPAAPYADRLDALRAAGIALWDVLQHCERPGSLDARIRRDTVIVNDFAGLFRRYPGITAVFCNGATAHETFRRQVLVGLDAAHAAKPCSRLPSTSPAHASMSVAEKTAVWCAAIRPYLD